MTENVRRHTKSVKFNMERLNSANDIDMELFDQYYEPGIEPLTKGGMVGHSNKI